MTIPDSRPCNGTLILGTFWQSISVIFYYYINMHILMKGSNKTLSVYRFSHKHIVTYKIIELTIAKINILLWKYKQVMTLIEVNIGK